MFICIFNLDFAGAIRQNPAVFILLPVFAYFFIFETVNYIKTGSLKTNKKQDIVLYVITALLVVFGILRNIPCFSFLAPH